MKKTALLAVASAVMLTVLPGSAGAAGPQLSLPDFSHLHGKATESVDITVNGFLLKIASKFAHAADEGEREALDLLNDIKSVHVRNFEFAHDDEYSREDVDAVRRQLSAPGWNLVVQRRQREPREDVDVFINTEGDRILGIAVIASEPRSFTIVNVIGNIDVDRLAKLEGQFGIPKVSK